MFLSYQIKPTFDVAMKNGSRRKILADFTAYDKLLHKHISHNDDILFSHKQW